MTHLLPFKALIKEKCGLSFDASREAILAEGLKTRLRERSLASQDEYLAILACDPNEFDCLINLITVNETYFFREPIHFSLMTERLLPELASRPAADRIKIVCAGCSTGEEPYTVAMSLMKKYGAGFSKIFSVVGFDIDEHALEKARSGIYSGHSFRGVPDDARKDFFEDHRDGCRVKDVVREGVRFLRQNIFGDAYPESVRNADVIFYRNVSIYFDPEEQQRIFRNLASLLRENGYLFLSSSETFAHNFGVLSLVERDGIFLYRKGVEVRIEERRRVPTAASITRQRPVPSSCKADESISSMRGSAHAPRGSEQRGHDDAHRLFDRALRCAEGKEYRDALMHAENVILLKPDFVKAHMLQAGVLINQKRFDEAETACRRGMEFDKWCLEGHLLLGLIMRARGNNDEAKKRFAEAIYIKPSAWLAHFHLGELYQAEGDRDRAGREFEIVIKQLEAKGACEHGLTFFPFAFPLEQVAHLCRHTLSRIRDTGRNGKR